jgi:hypothetical protein
MLGLLNNERRRAAALIALLAVFVLALGACGGDEEPETETAPAVIDDDGGTTVAGEDGRTSPADEPAEDPVTDETAVEATLERVLTSTDPGEVCMEFVTERYVRRAFGDEAGCRQAQSQQAAADRVQVSEVVVTPESTAQAVVRARGGVYDGQRLRAELVLDAGLWRLDGLRSNVPVGP